MMLPVISSSDLNNGIALQFLSNSSHFLLILLHYILGHFLEDIEWLLQLTITILAHQISLKIPKKVLKSESLIIFYYKDQILILPKSKKILD